MTSRARDFASRTPPFPPLNASYFTSAYSHLLTFMCFYLRGIRALVESGRPGAPLGARSGLTESRGIPKGARVRFNLLAFDWRPAGMARAYSLDLRERVVGAVAAGDSLPAVGEKLMARRSRRVEGA